MRRHHADVQVEANRGGDRGGVSNPPRRPSQASRGELQGETPQRQGQAERTGRGDTRRPGGSHAAGHQARRLHVGD